MGKPIRQFLVAPVLFLCLGLSAAGAAEEPMILDVWPGNVPGETGKAGPERLLELKPGEKPIQKLTDVSKPTLTVYRAPKDKDTGAAVVICPGGGYSIL